MARNTYIDDKATVVHSSTIDDRPEPEGEPPAGHLFRIERRDGAPLNCADVLEWRATLIRGIGAAASADGIRATLARNETVFDDLWKAGHEADVVLVRNEAESRVADLESREGG